jgi:hypothetical protein
MEWICQDVKAAAAGEMRKQIQVAKTKETTDASNEMTGRKTVGSALLDSPGAAGWEIGVRVPPEMWQ